MQATTAVKIRSKTYGVGSPTKYNPADVSIRLRHARVYERLARRCSDDEGKRLQFFKSAGASLFHALADVLIEARITLPPESKIRRWVAAAAACPQWITACRREKFDPAHTARYLRWHLDPLAAINATRAAVMKLQELHTRIGKLLPDVPNKHLAAAIELLADVANDVSDFIGD